VNDPAQAIALDRSLDALRRITPRLRLVAVVSGRPVEFLRERIPIDGIVLVGQYGLERLVDGQVVLHPGAEEFVDAVARAATDAEQRWPELHVERKGHIAFTVHWRTAPGTEPADADLRALSDRHGLVLQPARRACEFRPPIPVDKGTAFRAVGEEASPAYVAYAGDDDGDLAAFRTVLSDPDDGLEPVRIAVWSPEAPEALLDLADVVVTGPEGLADLLGDLADAVTALAQP
jgi:trehalose 6-phosphate phosphatase